MAEQIQVMSLESQYCRDPRNTFPCQLIAFALKIIVEHVSWAASASKQT
jgi:hypothetical protein